MSGFVGIVNLDGRGLDPALLHRMTCALAARGPDGQSRWQCGPAGLGHSRLDTSDAPADVPQPLTLDAATWIVADARIDARDDLRGRLDAAGQRAGREASDAELILRAYRAWGDACVERLLGDFAFAVWDARARRLFAARDQIGVRSFFYALVDGTLVVSNTIGCLRRHPGVSDRLDDLAVADFLLFEMNQDPSTTVFADIRRLPPAHTASWSAAGTTFRRYWTLPVDEPIFYRRPQEYVEQFTGLLDSAVSDRIRGTRVGIFMSGGLDSSTLAATSVKALGRRGQSGGVRAYTTKVEGLDRDESVFARQVADHLRIPLSIVNGGDAAFDEHWSARAPHTPMPVRGVTTLASDRQAFLEMSRHSRVAFYGEGPDNALQYEWQAYFRYLRRGRRYARLAGDLLRHVRSHRRLPLQSLVPRLLRSRRERHAWDIPYPAWLDPGLERRLGLRERWEQYSYLQPAPVEHPVRPAAHASFCGPEWEHLCRGFDAEETGAPLEVCHPYLDLRLLRFLLAVPPVPWCRSKHLIRRAMRRDLPAAVLTRPKTGMLGDPDYRFARRVGLPPLAPEPALRSFVDPARVPDVSGSDMIAFRTDFRPRALNHWLKTLTGDSRNEGREIEHDAAHA